MIVAGCKTRRPAASAPSSDASPCRRCGRLEAGTPFDPAHAALACSTEARVDAFYAAVERLVIPRLGALGLDGARAWRDRYRRSD